MLIYALGYQYIKPTLRCPLIFFQYGCLFFFFPPLTHYGISSGGSKIFHIQSHSERQYQRNSDAMNGSKTCLLYLMSHIMWLLRCICGRISVRTEITPLGIFAVLLKVFKNIYFITSSDLLLYLVLFSFFIRVLQKAFLLIFFLSLFFSAVLIVYLWKCVSEVFALAGNTVVIFMGLPSVCCSSSDFLLFACYVFAWTWYTLWVFLRYWLVYLA